MAKDDLKLELGAYTQTMKILFSYIKKTYLIFATVVTNKISQD